jgi:23S rRNA (uracil1939-C5)-methyltransferase
MNEAVVKIEKMVFGGAGFGHLDGKACFVPFTLPGDVARIRIKVAKRSFLEGELLELIDPSDRRVIPPCPVFSKCGGCSWQHISYPDQLAAKEQIFAEFLLRSGRLGDERLLPIIPAAEPYAYRSRVQLKLRFIDGRLHLGFYRVGSHFVVDMPEECAIAHPGINRVIAGLRLLVPQFPEADKIPQIDAAIGDNGMTELIVHYIGDHGHELCRFLEKNRHGLGADRLFLQTGRKTTLERVSGEDSPELAYTVPNRSCPDSRAYRMAFGSGGFAQVNYRQNLALIETVCNWAGLTGVERVLDIYCGNGNFSIPLACIAAEVVGVEDYEPSIEIARRNCAANGIGNASFVCADAAAYIEKQVTAGAGFDVVLLDPPRSGAAEVVKSISALKPRTVLYVSCDPSTLARDIGILRKSGFEVVRSRPVDMFPQTYHIESVTQLEFTG